MKKPAPANGWLVRALCEDGRLLEITADQSSRLQTEALASPPLANQKNRQRPNTGQKHDD
jgi:hypothetical protein